MGIIRSSFSFLMVTGLGIYLARNYNVPNIKKLTEGIQRARFNSEVHKLLECPVCMNLIYPPIHQCPNGHTLCSDCKAKVNNCCPICRHELGNNRCLALEKVAELQELPCRYKSLGCRGIFPYHCKLRHEQNCGFLPYNCPYAVSEECDVTGDIPFLVMHLKDAHKADMLDGCTCNIRVKSNPQEVEKAIWSPMVFNCYGRQFCWHFEAFQLGSTPVYMAFLTFMGDEIEAKKFSYTIEVGNNGRTLTWQGIPRSIRDSHKRVRDSQDGLIIPRNLALFFSTGSSSERRQTLKIKVGGGAQTSRTILFLVGLLLLFATS